MRKSILVVIACLLTVTLVRAADLTPADQKWLQAVEKMVSKGEKVTTPKEERVNIVKDWADKNGYSVKVNKVGNTFSIEFSVKETSKTVAQK